MWIRNAINSICARFGGTADGNAVLMDTSITTANANKLLCVDSNGKIKTVGQIAKGFMVRGIVPYEFGFGEVSTTSRFLSYIGNGGAMGQSRGWPAMSVTSATNSYAGFNPTNGSASVTTQAKYNHPSYGLNLSAPLMVELDVLNTVVGANAEFSFYLTAQERLLFTGTTVITSTTVTCSSTTLIKVGMPVSGTGIPASTTVASIVDATSFTISAAATASGTVSVTVFGNPSGAIMYKGFGFRFKADGTARLESHDGTTATTTSYFATTINTSYNSASTLGNKVMMVSDGATIYLYVNEVFVTSTPCPSGLSPISSTSYYTLYQVNLNGNGAAHAVYMSNPRIYY